MTTEGSIPRRLIDKLLDKMLPLVAEVIDLLQQNADNDGLTPKLKQWIERFEVTGWAEAYEDPKNFLLAHFSALGALGDSEEHFPKPSGLETIEGVQRWLDEVWEAVERILDDDEDDWLDPFADNPEQPIEYVTLDDGTKIAKPGIILAVALVICFNYFACMVHRKSLFQLVTEAKFGDDDALLKAVQSDKYCIAHIDYFRDRIVRAVLEGDDSFVRRVMSYRKKPAFKSATEHQGLYLVFALLDALNFLDAYAADLERFADFCQGLGVYGPQDDAVDVASFAKILRRFRRSFVSFGVPRQLALIVKDKVLP